MMRSIVVLPQPDGPTKAPTCPRASEKERSRSTSREPPDAASYDLRWMCTSSRSEPPAGCASFKGLHQQGFDRQYDDYERQRIGENAGHVEQLEGDADLESDAVGAPEQFDHEHDLPHE